MKTEISIYEPLWQTLQSHLFRDAPREGAAVLLCKLSQSSAGNSLVAHSLLIPEARDLEVQEAGAVGFTKAYLKRLLKLCKQEKLHLVACHSHPFSEKDVWFSSIDDAWDEEFCAYTAHALPGMLHGSLVIGKTDCDVRIFDKASKTFYSVSRIKIVGKSLIFLYPTSVQASEMEIGKRFDRQAAIFGQDGQIILRDQTVAIIGVGGTGAHVVQQLTYLGIRHFILIDEDVVETTNLNRLVGSFPQDAENGVLKVEVAKRMIQSIAPEAKVLALAQSVMESLDALKQTDVIFGCVDADLPRLFLTRFPSQYLCPYIDVATGISARDNQILEVYGQVRLVLPGGPCLSCMGGLSFESIREGMLSEQEKAWERRHGYGLGQAVTAPSVVALNGTLASLGVMEFMNLIGRFREPCLYLYYDGRSIDRVAFGVSMDKSDDCPICGWNTLGLADSKSIPDFSAKPVQLPKRKEVSNDSKPTWKTYPGKSQKTLWG